jgi:hypothetical protein
MKMLRAKFALATKRLNSKDFGMAVMRNVLPAYLNLRNGYVPGLLGFGQFKPKIAEKALRVVHAAAFLTALLGHEGQKIFWMSDHDAICPDAEAHKRLLQLFHNVLTLYTNAPVWADWRRASV